MWTEVDRQVVPSVIGDLFFIKWSLALILKHIVPGLWWTDRDCNNYNLKSSDIPESDSGIISVQLLEFKTSLLEAVEELLIHRDAETHHEAQIRKVVLEKQEIEWQMVKFQLNAELKDKEISSLKEELKLLQEQKVQLQTQVKDSHLNQLGEVEKRFMTISRQCAVFRQVHEKLEQNVEEAMRINKKIVSINKKQESTIATLKKDLERLTGELVKSKVVSVSRSEDQSSYYLLKDQELQEVKEKLNVETKLNKKLSDEIAVERVQKQVLKREHEMVRERSKEKEDRLVRLMDDYKRSNMTLEKEDGLDDDFDIHKSSPTILNCDVEPNKDTALVEKAQQASPQNNCEHMRHCVENEDVPDERTAECQEAAIAEENDEVNVRSQMDRTTLVLPPSEGLDNLAPDHTKTSTDIGGLNVTNQQIDSAVNQDASVSESAPVLSECSVDNGNPTDAVQSYTDICLTKLSEPQTRSVYGVASDPVMSETKVTPAEKSLCVYETPEHQTPVKLTSKVFNFKVAEPQITAPEINEALCVLPNGNSKSCVEENVTFVEENTEPRDAPDKSLTKYGQLGEVYLGPQQQIIAQESDTFSAALISQTSFCELQSRPDTLEEMDNHVRATKAEPVPVTESIALFSSAESSSQSLVFIKAKIADSQGENKTDNICTFAVSAQTNKQKAEASPNSHISNPHEDSEFTEIMPNNAQKQMSIEPDYNGKSKKWESSLGLDMPLKATSSSQSAEIVETNNPSETSRVFISEQRSMLPSGFQDLLNSLCTPVCPKSTLKKHGGPIDKVHASDIHHNQKSDHHGEWDAIKETFSEISTEKTSRSPISFGSAQPGIPAACYVGYGLRQNCTVTPPDRFHSLGKVSQPLCEVQTPMSLKKEDYQKSDIRTQIAMIEEFLSSEGLRPQKRPRLNEVEQ
ncbi:Coiled-coil domain-containing protein 73 [Bagarius yarrelli]|uniref:Coiled-coil domain-containing protein 73 n=1 Tax=Bagarius yarrelli TaxID=175774 RepID=A0A556V0N8_BAGYA|nr:Coiled-coil domain-containing protein 73 [Bagarius yarrelli]